MTSILIAEDHAVVRAGYRAFLSANGGFREIGEVSSGTEVLEQLRARCWDLLLQDIHLRDGTGVDLLRQVRREFRNTRVLVASGLPEEQYAIEALRAGAAGFLSKDCAPAELVSAVRRVLGGQRYISSRIAEQMAENLSRPTTPRHEQLSDRERQVFDQLASGQTITWIAGELELSIKTISTYKSRIMQKMSLHTISEMTSYASVLVWPPRLFTRISRVPRPSRTDRMPMDFTRKWLKICLRCRVAEGSTSYPGKWI